MRWRIFRRPIFWILVVIAGAFLVSQMFTSGPSYKDVDTSFALDQLNKGGIKKALILDKEQVLQLELAQKITLPDKSESDRIQTQYPSGTAAGEVFNSVDEAKQAGYDIEIGRFPFSVSGRAMAIDETEGFVKVIIDKRDNRVLGIHVVGPEASDLISEGALAIEMGAFAEDIALTVHPHPTLGEAVMEAAKHAIGEAIHVGNRRR